MSLFICGSWAVFATILFVSGVIRKHRWWCLLIYWLGMVIEWAIFFNFYKGA